MRALAFGSRMWPSTSGSCVYNHVAFKAAGAGVLLALMAVAAVILRDRAMIFGWFFFVITITPVALISSRPGYVLYVPDLGLGIFFAAAIAGLARRVPRGVVPPPSLWSRRDHVVPCAQLAAAVRSPAFAGISSHRTVPPRLSEAAHGQPSCCS